MTATLPRPAARPAVGVKTAVRVRPGPPLRALSVPPATSRSPVWATASQTRVLPGSSLKLSVMLLVWPTASAALALLTVTVGATVSMAITGVVPAVPALPAASL